jgi:DNA-directed RNA polymerase III subunit RPC1
MAKILTFPERVNKFNIDRLKAAILNGPENHPGANYILPKNSNNKYNLLYGQRRKRADE